MFLGTFHLFAKTLYKNSKLLWKYNQNADWIPQIGKFPPNGMYSLSAIQYVWLHSTFKARQPSRYLLVYSKQWNIITMCKFCSKLTIKAPEWCHSGVFIFNFEKFSYCFDVSIVGFEQVNIYWENLKML